MLSVILKRTKGRFCQFPPLPLDWVIHWANIYLPRAYWILDEGSHTPLSVSTMVTATIRANGPQGRVRLRRHCWAVVLVRRTFPYPVSRFPYPISTCPNGTHSSKPYSNPPLPDAVRDPPPGWNESLLSLHCCNRLEQLLQFDQLINESIISFVQRVFVTHNISAIQPLREWADE